MSRKIRHKEEDLSFADKTYKAKITITPRTQNQVIYYDLLRDLKIPIVIATGPAGTGKTMMATQAGIKFFNEEKFNKIIITRPAVSVDEQHGFLPGDLNKKMDPWVRPIIAVFQEHYQQADVEFMIKERYIDIVPFAYMRGLTFKNAWIIADEIQNTTIEQMKMLLTRIGEGSKLICTGDLEQHDRGFQNNGLRDFISRLKDKEVSLIKTIDFTDRDIIRHPVVTEVLNLYK